MAMISKGYTLWLMPKGEIYNRFADLIKRLGEQYDDPIFEPHVTLLGEILKSEEETIKLTQELVAGQKPFPITLRQIDYQEHHFRTLFVKAEVTESLQDLHNRAKEIFEMDIPPYMPHLSILYGNYQVGLKKKIISEIGKDQTATFDVSSVHLMKGGKIEGWQIIKDFPFPLLSSDPGSE